MSAAFPCGVVTPAMARVPTCVLGWQHLIGVGESQNKDARLLRLLADAVTVVAA